MGPKKRRSSKTLLLLPPLSFLPSLALLFYSRLFYCFVVVTFTYYILYGGMEEKKERVVENTGWSNFVSGATYPALGTVTLTGDTTKFSACNSAGDDGHSAVRLRFGRGLFLPLLFLRYSISLYASA